METDSLFFAKVYKCLFDPDRYPEFSELSALAKLLYCLMLDEKGYAEKIQQKNSIGEIYIVFTAERIAKALGIGKDTAMKLVKQLEDHKLLRREKQIGKADRIVLKDIEEVIHISTLSTEPPLENSDGSDNNPLEFSEGDPLKNSGRPLEKSKGNKNTTENSIDQIYSFFPDQTDQDDKNDGRNERTPSTTSYERVEVDREAWSEFLKLGFHLAYSDGAIYKSLFECLMRILENPKSTINVHGKPEDYDRVIQRLCRISESDLDYAATMVSRFKSPIRNPNAFYTTVLYDCVGNGDAGMMKLAEADLQKGDWKSAQYNFI